MATIEQQPSSEYFAPGERRQALLANSNILKMVQNLPHQRLIGLMEADFSTEYHDFPSQDLKANQSITEIQNAYINQEHIVSGTVYQHNSGVHSFNAFDSKGRLIRQSNCVQSENLLLEFSQSDFFYDFIWGMLPLCLEVQTNAHNQITNESIFFDDHPFLYPYSTRFQEAVAHYQRVISKKGELTNTYNFMVDFEDPTHSEHDLRIREMYKKLPRRKFHNLHRQLHGGLPRSTTDFEIVMDTPNRIVKRSLTIPHHTGLITKVTELIRADVSSQPLLTLIPDRVDDLFVPLTGGYHNTGGCAITTDFKTVFGQDVKILDPKIFVGTKELKAEIGSKEDLDFLGIWYPELFGMDAQHLLISRYVSKKVADHNMAIAILNTDLDLVHLFTCNENKLFPIGAPRNLHKFPKSPYQEIAFSYT